MSTVSFVQLFAAKFLGTGAFQCLHLDFETERSDSESETDSETSDEEDA